MIDNDLQLYIGKTNLQNYCQQIPTCSSLGLIRTDHKEPIRIQNEQGVSGFRDMCARSYRHCRFLLKLDIRHTVNMYLQYCQ